MLYILWTKIGTPFFTFSLAVRHLSHHETCPEAMRYLPIGASKYGLSQPERCLIAKRHIDFADSMP